MPRVSLIRCLLFALLAFPALGQPSATNAPARRPTSGPLYSPEIQADRKVTFSLRAPLAKEVKLTGEWSGQAVMLTNNGEGTWSITVGPLQPELYGYGFIVDGVRMADPGNPLIKPMRSPTTSILDIPGVPPRLHDLRQVPHGGVTAHSYYSEELQSWRRVHVYTPPGYEKSERTYPTLYLFHGSGDNDATWASLGRANVIVDNLIAEGRARPMVIVMPDGHPLAGRITGAPGPDVIRKNSEAFATDLLHEVMPLVEKTYRVSGKREARAIAGLSMGGGQSIYVGLNHPELFSYVGGFSSYVVEAEKTSFAVFEGKEAPMIWMACGKDDRLMDNAKELAENLQKHGIKHELVVTDGNHSWPVWRKHLARFAPMLFKDLKDL